VQEEITDVMLAKFYGILRRAVKEELSTLYESVESALKGMLKPDVKEDARIFSICVDVTCRKCIEMTYNWVFNYISFDGKHWHSFSTKTKLQFAEHRISIL
jgi:hypothetical protein